MANLLDDLVGSMLSGLRQPLESFIQLETADDNYTLVARDARATLPAS